MDHCRILYPVFNIRNVRQCQPRYRQKTRRQNPEAEVEWPLEDPKEGRQHRRKYGLEPDFPES
jgi:hypothetical protein